MPYRRTENVSRKLAARHGAIMGAARALAAESGMRAVQIAAVAERAGIAAGTVYRYFPAKTDLVTALVAAQSAAEIAALNRAADAAPGPLSALAAAIVTFAARALASPRLAFAMIAEPVEPELDAARLDYRGALAGAFETRIRSALERNLLPGQDAGVAAAALVGALIEGLIGPLAPGPTDDPVKYRAQVQTLTLFGLRGLGVIDARARGLVVQTALPPAA
ncbi:MAG TPA: helix-turn-helix domain-containing protein [Xanthobacteraceae bacterium]|nr:helix-turn-helix domain-containing protein [Xanthobacteraceae bacterium]